MYWTGHFKRFNADGQKLSGLKVRNWTVLKESKLTVQKAWGYRLDFFLNNRIDYEWCNQVKPCFIKIFYLQSLWQNCSNLSGLCHWPSFLHFWNSAFLTESERLIVSAVESIYVTSTHLWFFCNLQGTADSILYFAELNQLQQTAYCMSIQHWLEVREQLNYRRSLK